MRNTRMALVSTLFLVLGTAACQDAVAPTSDLSAAGTAVFAAGGNSAAAHACQQGGYLNLFRTDGTGFRNTGECVSYAAHGGVLVTRVTATFTNGDLRACNNVTIGYEIGGVMTDVETKPYGCFAESVATFTVTYLSNQTVRIYLRDNTCGHVYLEDGSHGAVTGSNPYLIRIADSGGFCERPPEVPWTPVGDEAGNLNVTKTVS